MPINLSVGGKKAGHPEMELAIKTAENDYQQTLVNDPVADAQAFAGTPAEVTDATMVNPDNEFLQEYNKGATQQALINNHGWTNQEVMENPTRYETIRGELIEATGDVDIVPEFDFDDLPGSGPLGRRIGQNTSGQVGAGSTRATAADLQNAIDRGASEQEIAAIEKDMRPFNQATPEKVEAIERSRQFQQDLHSGDRTDQQIVEDFNLQKRSKDSEFAGIRPTQIISGYRDLSKAVDNQVQRLTSGLNSKGKADLEAQIAGELGLGINSVSKVLNGLVTNYAYAKQNGIPRAFSDILLAAHLNAGKKAHSAMLEKEANALKGEQDLHEVDGQEALLLSTATDATAGRSIAEAMGMEVDNDTNAILGAIARKVVGDTFGSDAVKGTDQEALFDQTQRAVAVQKSKKFTQKYNAQELNEAGHKMYRQMEPIIDLILPSAKKMPRRTRKVTQSEFVNTRKATKDRAGDFGGFESINKFVDELENTPAGFDMDLDDQLSTGNFIQKYQATRIMGDIFKYEYDENGEIVKTDGIDPMTGKPNKHQGNMMRKLSVDKEIAYAMELGKGIIYFDYFPGGNNRIYVDATVGNWQSQKLPRAMLQSATKITYDLSQPAEIAELQAGVMKKLGSIGEIHFDKRSVAVSVEHFNANAEKWSNLMTRESKGGPDAEIAADEILKIAADGEGLAGISAIMEGVKLYRAMKAHEQRGRLGVAPGTTTGVSGKIYTTKFLSESDGVANGVAHSALQGGSQVDKINRAVNLFSAADLKALENDPDLSYDDTYIITANGMLDRLMGIPDSNLGDLLKESGMINRSMGKKPMMVFGYGAGKETIRDGVKEVVSDWFKSNPQAAKKVLDGSDLTLKEIQQHIADSAWLSVDEEFKSVKIVNDVMRELVEAAANSNLMDSLVLGTAADHNVVLGLKETVANPDAYGGNPPRVAYSDKKGGTTKVLARERFTDSFGYTDMGKLKAAAQAGVLGIHAMDAINLMMTWENMGVKARKKNAEAYVNAFQIFDGVMMPPKHARAWAKQLNHDFYKVNTEYSITDDLYQKLRKANVSIPAKTLTKLAKIRSDRALNAKKMRAENIRQFFWDLKE